MKEMYKIYIFINEYNCFMVDRNKKLIKLISAYLNFHYFIRLYSSQLYYLKYYYIST